MPLNRFQMQGFEEQLRQDIAESLRVDSERVELIGIQKCGVDSRWELDLNILKCAEPGDRVAHKLGNGLVEQATDRNSMLRRRLSTAAITGWFEVFLLAWAGFLVLTFHRITSECLRVSCSRKVESRLSRVAEGE